jgi:hypothetical protein
MPPSLKSIPKKDRRNLEFFDRVLGNYESAGGMSFLHPSDPFAPVGT